MNLFDRLFQKPTVVSPEDAHRFLSTYGLSAFDVPSFPTDYVQRGQGHTYNFENLTAEVIGTDGSGVQVRVRGRLCHTVSGVYDKNETRWKNPKPEVIKFELTGKLNSSV